MLPTPSNSGVIAKIQLIDINGYKGDEGEQFDTNSLVRLNGTIIHSKPFHVQTALFLYNNKDKMTYSIFANSNQTLTELLDVARSIR